MASDAPTEIVTTRRHQMFPVLTESEIARISRFGNMRRYECGARLFAAGEPGPGMFVVLKGVVAISQRDGLGHVVPVVRLGPGEFSGEIAQLSGRHGLVDGYAEGRFGPYRAVLQQLPHGPVFPLALESRPVKQALSLTNENRRTPRRTA